METEEEEGLTELQLAGEDERDEDPALPSLGTVEDSPTEAEEEATISGFRLKLLEAQMQSDQSLLHVESQEQASFNEKLEKGLKDGELALKEMENALSSLVSWRTNHSTRDLNVFGEPETDAFDGASAGAHEDRSKLLQLADEMLASGINTQALPQSNLDSFERRILDWKEQASHDQDADTPYPPRGSSNNHKAALDVDFNRINYEAVLQSQESAWAQQQALLMEELQCERDISSLVHQLDLLDENLSAVLSSSDPTQS